MTDPVPSDGIDPDQSHEALAVEFYWRNGCMFCTALRRRLRSAGVSLDERNIWEDPDAAAFVRSVADGNETVPTVVAGGHALVNPTVAEVLTCLGQTDHGDRRPGRAANMVQRLLGGKD